jgi:hypothetical protein
MKRLVLTTAALAAAVAVFVFATIQPRSIALSPSTDGSVAGVIHIHTNRSDGLSGPDEIAAAAARAGLTFVVFTDHGDGTRRPDPPEYRAGVLCLDGVEISTTGGHYVALDMPAAPYPLGGEARDVVEDVRRLGGFGIAAHPDSPKPELRWRDWAVAFDGIELVNPDTSWREWAGQTRSPEVPASGRWFAARRLGASLIDYPFRPAETIAGLLNDPAAVSTRWAALTERRRVVTLAGADAHARLALRNADPSDSRFALPFPSYESSFRTLSVHVRLDRPLTGHAPDDAKLIVGAIRAGHLYTAIDAMATPPSLEFTAANASGTAAPGDELRANGPVKLRVRSNAPPGFTATVWDGMKVVSSDHHEPDFTVDVPEQPAVYWVEVRKPADPRERTQRPPWVRSNAIYVRGPEPLTRPLVRPPVTRSTALFEGSLGAWRVEQDSTSVGAVDTVAGLGGRELGFRYGLSTQITPAPFVAMVVDTPDGMAASTRLAFTARADRQMRVSVQLRAPRSDGASERWQRSVYVDTSDAERVVFFDELTPIGMTSTFKPPLEAIRSILFVVDPVNTKRSTSGNVYVKRVSLQQ